MIEEVYTKIVKRLAEVKNFKPKPRPLNEAVLSAIEETLPSKVPFFIVKAPTGYGKTTISYTLAAYSAISAEGFDRVIHVLPMRSIIEDIDRTAKEAFGFSRVKMMNVSEETFHLYPLNITTVDTFTWDIMKLNTKKFRRIIKEKEYGYDYLTQASITTSLVVFDEAHFILEDKLLRRAFNVVLKFLISLKVPIIILTATLPKGYEALFKSYLNREIYEFRTFEIGETEGTERYKVVIKDETFLNREKEKDFQISLQSSDDYLKFVQKGKRNLIVVNTVPKAVKIYKEIKELGFENILLIHGRMTSGHKRRLIERLREWRNEEEFLVVATQVIEAGVDISADIMVTEAAPINSLLQRFGRVARYEEKEAKIFILPYGGTPYDEAKVRKTLENLENAKNFHPRLTETYQWIVDEVHGKSKRVITTGIRDVTFLELLKLISNPAKRSIDVWNFIKSKIRQGEAILREFLIPVTVGDDKIKMAEEIVLISPKMLYKLAERGEIEVFVDGNKITITDLSDSYDIAKRIATGENIAILFTGQYDEECGLI